MNSIVQYVDTYVLRHSAGDMWMFLVISLGTIHTLRCSDVSSMEQYDSSQSNDQNHYEQISKFKEVLSVSPTEKSDVSPKPKVRRRYWLVTSKSNDSPVHETPFDKEEKEKDENLKSKIATLVEQTLHDTGRKLRAVQKLKERHKEEAEYKIGFILSLVKKTRDVLNELFNVAIKHKDETKALEQLKIFEFIVHTNVDTTNLVRQMVEIHVQHLNSTNTIQHRNRVVLL